MSRRKQGSDEPFLPLMEDPRALAASVPVVLSLKSGFDVMLGNEVDNVNELVGKKAC